MIILTLSSETPVCASYPGTNTHTISVGSAPTSIALTEDYLFVTNSFEDTVSVIDIDTYSVEETIDVGDNPMHVIANATGTKIYVTNKDDDSISVISVTDLEVDDTITGIGEGPAAMCFSASGDKLYVACTDSDSVVIVSTSDDTKSDSITGVGDGPAYLAITSDNKYLYVTLENASSVSIIDLSDNSVTDDKIAVGTKPQGIAITPGGNYIYTANLSSDSLSDISVSSGRVVETVSDAGDGVKEIVILSNGETAIVTNSNSSNVSVVNILDNTVTETITVGSTPNGICASDDDLTVYVANKGSNTVTVLEDQALIRIDSVDKRYLNASATSQISWHTTESGTYQIEIGGDGTKDSGTVIESGSVTSSDAMTTDIDSATHLVSGDGAYKVYFYLTITGGAEHTNDATLILDTIAPSAPTGLESDFGDTKVTLTYDETNDSDIDKYNIYYGTATGTYDNSVETAANGSYTLTGLTNGTTYYIAIAAIDIAGNESAKSTEISETPDEILGLAGLTGEEGCFIATAAYEKNNIFNRLILNIIDILRK